MRRIALGAMLLAGCLGERTTHCPGGYICPDSLACAAAPVYCGKSEEVAACEGKQTFDSCAYTTTVAGACYGAVCFPCDNDREGCGPAGWYAMTPATVNLNGVWVSARGDAYAVGEHGTVLHYDGTGWSTVVVPPLTADVTLRGVWGTSSSDVFIVGDSGTLLHFDGTTWTADTSTSASLLSVWGSGPHDVFAVGFTTFPSSSSVRHYDGTSWTTATMTSSAGPFYAIGGSGPADVYAVGKRGATLSYDGSSWQPSIAAPEDLDAVWSLGPKDVLFAGGTNSSLIVHGAALIAIDGCIAKLTSLWGAGGQLFAGGVGGCLLSSSDGNTWSGIPPPPASGNPDIHAIGGSGVDDVFAVGAGGAIWHSRGL